MVVTEIDNVEEDEGDDPRYPYTYAADLMRMTIGYNEEGAKISRLDASLLRQLISKVMDLNDWDVADQLATYYLDIQQELTDKAVRKFMAAKKKG
jgi:hypothetical protein